MCARQYLLLSQFCGVLGTIIRLATCGHCTSRGYDVDAGPGASKDMTYTEAEEGGYVHGQHTYHFVDNPWCVWLTEAGNGAAHALAVWY